MIQLDTNFLIAAMKPGTPAAARLLEWLDRGEAVSLSVVVWTEVLCGPLSLDEHRLAVHLFPNPEPLLPEDAVLAARLFNVTGRRRSTLPDGVIAATALRLGAPLATQNLSDFQPLIPHGLQLV